MARRHGAMTAEGYRISSNRADVHRVDTDDGRSTIPASTTIRSATYMSDVVEGDCVRFWRPSSPGGGTEPAVPECLLVNATTPGTSAPL